MTNKYTLEDIIINPNDPRVKIGKEYYFSGSLVQCLKDANNEGPSRELVDVRPYDIHPFQIKDYVNVQCIIRKKEPSYIDRQNEWIKKNDIKIGDQVKVTRIASGFESGWGNMWFDCMDKQVGKILRVKRIAEIHSGIQLDDNFYYPFFVLEKVKEKYVPFDLSDALVRERLLGKRIVIKAPYRMGKRNVPREIHSVIIGFTFYPDNLPEARWEINIGPYWFTAEEALKQAHFHDMTPCGELVEDK